MKRLQNALTASLELLDNRTQRGISVANKERIVIREM